MSRTRRRILNNDKDSQSQGLYDRIRKIIENARGNIARVVNTEMVIAYWHIGREIVEEEQKGESRADYGSAILRKVSERLTADFGKGFDESNLRNIRSFYLAYPKRDALRHELSWTHYRILMRVGKPEARSFYAIECINNNWSARELERQKGSLLFERLALSKNKKGLMKLTHRGQELHTYEDMIKDPYILEFTGFSARSKLYESKLEQSLIDNLSKFLLELGKGFTFVARQGRISLDGDHFYIDLVFYNTILRCYVLIDLKIGKLVHQNIGQMQMYVNFYDREIKQPNDNPSVGLILCEDKKDAVVRYTLSKDNRQIFAYGRRAPQRDEKRANVVGYGHARKNIRKKDLVRAMTGFPLSYYANECVSIGFGFEGQVAGMTF